MSGGDHGFHIPIVLARFLWTLCFAIHGSRIYRASLHFFCIKGFISFHRGLEYWICWACFFSCPQVSLDSCCSCTVIQPSSQEFWSMNANCLQNVHSSHLIMQTSNGSLLEDLRTSCCTLCTVQCKGEVAHAFGVRNYEDSHMIIKCETIGGESPLVYNKGVANTCLWYVYCIVHQWREILSLFLSFSPPVNQLLRYRYYG
jgi:hypothetical protein